MVRYRCGRTDGDHSKYGGYPWKQCVMRALLLVLSA